MTLTVAVRPGEDRDLAGRMDADLARFVQPGARAEAAGDGRGRDPARFDVAGVAQTASLAARLRLFLARGETGDIGGLLRFGERRFVVARVVLQRDRRLIGKLRNEVPATDL